jgi:hypothetical protein
MKSQTEFARCDLTAGSCTDTMTLNVLECALSKAVIKKYSEKFSSAKVDTAIATEANLPNRFRLLFPVVLVTANVHRHNIKP